MANKLGIATYGVLLLATLLGVIGVALPQWVISEQVSIGLFQVCVTERGCISYTEVPGYLRGSQAMAVIGLLCVCASAVLSLFSLFRVWAGCPLTPRALGITTITLTAVAAVTLLVSVIIYGSNTTTVPGLISFGAGFGITIVSSILCLVVTILMGIIQMRGTAAPSQ